MVLRDQSGCLEPLGSTPLSVEAEAFPAVSLTAFGWSPDDPTEAHPGTQRRRVVPGVGGLVRQVPEAEAVSRRPGRRGRGAGFGGGEGHVSGK